MTQTMGRPREFDVDDALSAALTLFWRKGFEGTSLTDLTEAMGITRPSLYATFGNKEALFRKALDRYQETWLGFFYEALKEPTARRVVERLLTTYAALMTDGAHPPGCLGTNGALVCSEAAEPIRQELIELRGEKERLLKDRLERARAQGDLPANADPAALASYLTAVGQGMAVQAASGAGGETLAAVVRMTMAGWPSP